METQTKPVLELVGQDGNAFVVLGLAQKAARRAGWTKEQIKVYLDEAMAGNYDHLLQVTMKHFNVR